MGYFSRLQPSTSTWLTFHLADTFVHSDSLLLAILIIKTYLISLILLSKSAGIRKHFNIRESFLKLAASRFHRFSDDDTVFYLSIYLATDQTLNLPTDRPRTGPDECAIYHWFVRPFRGSFPPEVRQMIRELAFRPSLWAGVDQSADGLRI